MKRYTEKVASIEYLMSEWNWEENEKRGLDPNKLTLGSGKKASWICSKNHIWDADISHRVGRGSNCPYCANKKAWPGYNDLKSQRPDLMSEWDFETNTIDPSTVVVNSNKPAHWICPKGHKYTKIIYKRVAGENCRICTRSLRTSFPEQCFFFYTKKVFPDAENSYTDIFENRMELDIYIPSIKTGVEYDGIFWHDKNDKDVLEREEKKYQICKEKGIRLFRIKEGDFKGFANVSDRTWYIPKKCEYKQLDCYIMEYLRFLTMGGKKLPVVDVEKDKVEILEFKTLRLEDSLLYLKPEVAKEWHPTKNGRLTPDLFTPGSSEVVWWLCSKCGNEWQAPIANRSKGHGCDICATPVRMKTRKHNILAKRDSINKEWCLLDWDYQLNEHGPEYYTNGSPEVVTWRCHVCGYRWETAIGNRTRDYKNGCPFCSGKVIIRGFNDLPTVRSDLMEEWDYKKNADIDPTTVGVGSHSYAFWICKKCGYEWEVQIYNRANGKGCPCCANRVVVPGKNDLATTDPDLAAEWHPTLNTLKPTEVTRGQSTRIYWLCSVCGNTWQDTLNHRSGGRGCKECSKLKRVASSMKAVEMLDLNTGNAIKSFPSISAAARETKINHANIALVCKGTSGRTQAGGYGWKYKS